MRMAVRELENIIRKYNKEAEKEEQNNYKMKWKQQKVNSKFSWLVTLNVNKLNLPSKSHRMPN